MKTDLWPRFAGALWAVSFFLGFAYLPAPELARLGCVLSGFTALGLLIAAGGPLAQRSVFAPRLSLLLVLFALLALCNAAWSVAPYYSLMFVGGFLLLPATMLALFIAVPQARNDFLRCAVMGAGVVIVGTALWALIQIFFLPDILINGQPRNPFSNPNAFAGLLSLSFFAGLGLYLKGGAARTQRILWIGLLVILATLAGIAGKAASLALGIGLIALVIFGDRQILKARWKPLLSLGFCTLVLTSLMAVLADKRGAFDRVYGMILGGETATIENRIDIWHATLQLIAQHPLLGTGYGTFSQTYPSVRFISDYYSSGFMAHMDPLQFWAELGVLGPILFYAFGIGVLLMFLRFRKAQRKAGARPDMLVLSLFLGCGAFLAHSHVDFLFYTIPAFMAFSLAVPGLILRLGDHPDPVRPFSFMKRWAPPAQFFALILPVLVFLMLFVPVLAGEYYASRASRALKTGDLNSFAAAVNTGNQIGLGLNARPYLMAAMIPMGLLTEAAYLPLAEQQALFRQIDGLLAQSLRRNSRLATAWFQRGRMLRHLSPDIIPAGYMSAEEAFQTALRLDPLHLAARLALADLYEAEGKERAALDVLLAGVARPYPSYDAAPYYDRVEKMAMALGYEDSLPQIKEFATSHDNRVEGARRHDRALKAVLGRDEGNFSLIP